MYTLKNIVMLRKSYVIISLMLFSVTTLVFGQQTENRDLPSFNSVSVGEAIDVYLIPGSTESAKVKVDGIDLDEVLTEVRGDRLKIYLEKGNYRNIDVEVWLTYKNLSGIEVSSAASVITEGLLKSSSLRVEASSAGDGKLEIDVEELDVEISSSADLEIFGKTVIAEISVSSAGKFDGYELSCSEVEVSANSAGTARVNASKKLDATATSAGNIRYKGNPDKVYEDESSGGSVKSSN